jgi:hypothetical protein
MYIISFWPRSWQLCAQLFFLRFFCLLSLWNVSSHNSRIIRLINPWVRTADTTPQFNSGHHTNAVSVLIIQSALLFFRLDSCFWVSFWIEPEAVNHIRPDYSSLPLVRLPCTSSLCHWSATTSPTSFQYDASFPKVLGRTKLSAEADLTPRSRFPCVPFCLLSLSCSEPLGHREGAFLPTDLWFRTAHSVVLEFELGWNASICFTCCSYVFTSEALMGLNVIVIVWWRERIQDGDLIDPWSHWRYHHLSADPEQENQ